LIGRLHFVSIYVGRHGYEKTEITKSEVEGETNGKEERK
jgi:hypothetical protein